MLDTKVLGAVGTQLDRIRYYFERFDRASLEEDSLQVQLLVKNPSR